MGVEQLSALELGQKIKDKEITAMEAVQACFQVMDEKEPDIHAYIQADREAAMEQARHVQQGIMEGKYTSLWLECRWLLKIIYARKIPRPPARPGFWKIMCRPMTLMWWSG